MKDECEKYKKWEITRRKGKKRFMIINGALAWGIPTAVLWILGMSYMNPEFSTLFMSIVALIVFPIGGLLWGKFMWEWTEKAYGKHMQSSNETESAS